MPYFPKSSINILEVSVKGELLFKSNDSPYIGTYIATDNNQYYAGSDYLNLGPELYKPTSGFLPFGKNIDVRKYNLLKRNIFQRQKTYKSIIPTKVPPTQSDYKKGYFIRYYAQRVNDNNILFEITQKMAKQLNTTKGLDGNLYQTGQLIWALEGNVRKVNKINIEKLFSSSPQLLNLFPLLNEFENINNSNKLYTPGGELYYESGREYTGPYHMNDGLPMAGEMHTKEFHEILFFAKDLQTPNERKEFVDFNYEDFVKKQTRKKKRNWIKKSINASEGARNIFGNTPASSGRGVSSGGGASSGRASSGGGGGGY
tara:strand:+ start:13162 stop:14106 length:945 start_codon:yes stop_codon:yes gene_type:complete